MENLTIYVFWGNFPPVVGGGSSRGYRIYTELARRGHKIKVFVGKVPGTLFHERLSENIDLYRIPPAFTYPLPKGILTRILKQFVILFRYLFLLPFLVYLNFKDPAGLIVVEGTTWELSRKVMSKFNVNLVFLSPWALFRKIVKKPLILYYTNVWCAEDIQIVSECKYADKILIVDKWMGGKIASLGVDKVCDYIPVSVNTKNTIRNNPSNVVLFVGRLSIDKACDTLVRAVPYVVEKVDNVRFVIVGGGDDEEMLKRMVKDFEVGTNVEFAGFEPPERIGEYHKIATVQVNPVRSPGISNVVIEAMANGVPIIKSRYDEYKEYVVKDGVNGYTFEVDNPHDLAEKIVKVLSEPEKWVRLSENARKTAIGYDINTINDKFEKSILEIVDGV